MRRAGPRFVLATMAAFVLMDAAPAAQAPAPARPDEIQLRVVDRDGQPVSGAEVRFVVEDDRAGAVSEGSPPQLRQLLRMNDPPWTGAVDDLLESATPVRAGAAGEVRLEWPRERALLVAGRHDDLWGFRWFERDWRETQGLAHEPGQPLALELARDWALEVRVEDAEGVELEKATVYVRASVRVETSARRGRPNRFEHVGYQLRDTTLPFVVGIRGLLSSPVEKLLDSSRAPDGPVVLRMPPVGSVSIEVVGADGRPDSRPHSVELRLAQDAALDGSSPPSVGASTLGATAVFDAVSLHRSIDVTVDRSPTTIRIPGPTRAGERVRWSVMAPPRMVEPGEGPSIVSEAVATAVPEPSGSVRGVLLLGEGMPLDQVEVVVSWLDARGMPATSTAFVERSGAFRTTGVPVGSATIEVSMAARPFPVEQRSPLFQRDVGVVLEGHEDPRPTVIDLRGKLFLHRIELEGHDPRRSLDARVYFGPTWHPATRCYQRVDKLPLVLVSPWPTIDVEAFATGKRVLTLRDVGQRVTARLEPGIPVRLRLVTDGALPEPPRYLKAVLEPTDAFRAGMEHGGPAFGPTREVSTTACAPGRMRVRWMVERRERCGTVGSSCEVVPPQFVDVLDSDWEQLIALTLSADELARILSALD